MLVRRYSIENAPLEPMDEDAKVLLGDVDGDEDGAPMSVGYCRYPPDEWMDYTVRYDEVLVILKGSFAVRSRPDRRCGQSVGVSYIFATTGP
jgi:ethanolamine utilization protein EutQ (cupin superfamily)